MAIIKEVVNVKTSNKNELVDITKKVLGVVKKAGIREGLCTVFCPHTTAGLTINENADPAVKRDILQGLERMIPSIDFAHVEGNSDAHIKASIMGSSLQVLVHNNAIVLGTWQGIYLCDFDGPRSRKFHVQVMG